MEIRYDGEFVSNFNQVWDFIAKDSISRANIFKDELEKRIEGILTSVFKNRQSIYHTDKNVRDLIYKGYVIPYLVDEEKDIILILDIVKYRIPKALK